MGLILQFFEIVLTKRVGGKEPVGAHHLPRGMAQVSGVVEQGDAIGSTVVGRVVIAPFGTASPSRMAGITAGGDDLACSSTLHSAR